MGRRVNVPEITMGRDIERIEGAEKVQINAGGVLSLQETPLGCSSRMAGNLNCF